MRLIDILSPVLMRSRPAVSARSPQALAWLRPATPIFATACALVLTLLGASAGPVSAAAGADDAVYTFSPRFGTRKTELSDADKFTLDEIAQQWQGKASLVLEVIGHTDNVPIAPKNRKQFASNQALSEARAITVATYLAARLGIPKERVRVVGMGDKQPVASNATAAGRAKNRRVDVRLRALPAVASEAAEERRPSGAAVLARARTLLDQGKPDEALALLKSVEPMLIGNGEFDYLYGLAALESNELGEAMFALQRAVELDPGYAAARMELARAHFQTGDLPEAKRQFDILAGQNPPPGARAAIVERLAVIERMQSMLDAKLYYYLRAASGYDSNANSATDLNNFLGFDLSLESRETDSAFIGLGGGVRYLKPLSRSLRLDTRVDLSHRTNFDASFVDGTGLRANVGLRQEKARQIRSIGVQAYRQQVDNRLNSQGVALAGQWNFKLDDRWQLGVLGRVGTTRYGDDLRVKDVYEYLGGLSASLLVGNEDQGNVGISLVLGSENPIQDGSRYARDLYGFNAFANWAFSPRLQGSISAGVLKADYEEVFFPLEYPSAREDTLGQARLAAFWKFRPEWVLNPSLAWYSNSTDVQIFEFDRFELMLTVSRLW